MFSSSFYLSLYLLLLYLLQYIYGYDAVARLETSHSYRIVQLLFLRSECTHKLSEHIIAEQQTLLRQTISVIRSFD